MNKTFNIWFFLGKVVFIVILWGCNTETIYEQKHDFPKKFWHMDSITTFNFQVKNPEIPYDINYHLRNTASYPFYNIYVKYQLQDSLATRELATNMENFILFDPKTGKPKGGGLGDIFNHEYTLLDNYKFDSAGTYQLKLEHFMRRDTLPEVISIGVSVRKASGQD